MQLASAGLGKTVFPAWSAAASLVRDNGVDAAGWATKAVKEKQLGTRLDYAVRTMTSLDHAIDASRQLPVSWLVGGVGAYYRGYETAKQAVTLIIASGVVPGAREKVGLQTLLASKDEFLRGVGSSAADHSRFGAHLANGWVSSSVEDALTGLVMLRDQTVARPLVSGLEQVRQAVAKRLPVDPALVATITSLFNRATGGLEQQIGRHASGGVQLDPTALAALEARTAALLTQSGASASNLANAVPSAAEIDRLASQPQG